jgi:hypothetical protein
MNKIPNIKSFKESIIAEQLLSEAFPSGAQWEKIICVAYNMKSKSVAKAKAIELAGIDKWDPRFNAFLTQAKKLVNNAFGRPSGVMEHFGSGSASLSRGWNKYFIQTTGKDASAATKTPKTDMYIGRQHISLKKVGGSQLMSGGKAETLATLAYAYDRAPNKVKTKEMDKAWSAMSKQIENQYIKTQLPKGKTIGDVKKDIKTGTLSSLESASFTTLIKNTLQKNNAMTDAINIILQKDEIRQAVVREAMTGRDKFSTRLARASHMMVFSPAGSAEYKAINKSLVSTYASQTTFNISFKTAGTGKGAWTALKAIYSDEYEGPSLDNIINESIEESDNEMLLEGFFDFFRKGGAIVKKWISIVLGKIWNKIKSIFAKGLGYGLQILGLSLDANNPIVSY